MLDKDLASSSGSGAVTFFRSPRTTNSSVSLYLNIFQIITFFNLIRVAFGNNPPNPFNFINGNCFYDFSITDAWSQGWPAYVDVVNNLVNGSVGAITQYSDYVPANTIWDQTVCNSYFSLQSNCSLEIAQTFVSKFSAMFNNDTVVSTLKDCFKWDTTSKVALGVIAGICGLAVLFCLGMLVKAGIREGINCCNRRGYDNLDEEAGGLQLDSRK